MQHIERSLLCPLGLALIHGHMSINPNSFMHSRGNEDASGHRMKRSQCEVCSRRKNEKSASRQNETLLTLTRYKVLSIVQIRIRPPLDYSPASTVTPACD